MRLFTNELANMTWSDTEFFSRISVGKLVCCMPSGVVDKAISWKMQTAERTRPFQAARLADILLTIPLRRLGEILACRIFLCVRG